MRYFVLFLLAMISYSCSNDFVIIEEKKDIPIVYGFLSSSDTAQYIRIERAFIDESISALDLAQNPDSIYYDDLTVSILDEDSGNETFLTRVDGNLEGYVREEGAFAQTPNYLYKVKSENIGFDDTHSYLLQIKRNETLPLVTARTTLVGAPNFITPNPLSPDPTLDFDHVNQTAFSWGRGNNATVYDLYLDVNYDERPIGGSYQPKEVTWKVASNLSAIVYKQNGREFYTKLAAEIEENSNMERRFRGFDVTIVAGNAELQEYIRVGEANLGITSTQDIPTYSNLSEGRGIFASKNTIVFEGVGISPKSLDSLANGSITKQLNFKF